MSANKQQDSHRPPSDGSMAKEEFIRVGTTLYKIVEQPKLNGKDEKEKKERAKGKKKERKGEKKMKGG